MKDRKTILDLYNNYRDDIYTMTPEKMDISKKILQQEEVLLKTLTKEQKEILDKLNQYIEEKNEISHKQAFIFSYKLATNLLIEALDDDINN